MVSAAIIPADLWRAVAGTNVVALKFGFARLVPAGRSPEQTIAPRD